MPKMTIDNREAEVEAGATILDAAGKLGVLIPTMCYLRGHQAPTHFLVIPKKHLSGPGAVSSEDEALIGKVVRIGAQLARENGAAQCRLVMNNGADAGQTVFHLHLHVLGGRAMSWPPG